MLHRYSTQSSILKYEQYHPGQVSHYYAIESQLNGKLDIKALQLALASVVDRHEMLRCSIETEQNAQPLMSTINNISLEPIEFIDVSNHSNSCRNLKDSLVAAGDTSFFTKPIDLVNGKLWRAILLKTGHNQYQFGFICHPLIADHRSMQILLSEIENHYNQGVNTQHSQATTPEPALLEPESADNVTRLQYWQSKLNDLTITKLHTPKSFSGGMQFNGKHRRFSLSNALVTQLSNGIPDHSLENMLLASLYVLLRRYTGESDITLGACDANRLPEENHINACANFLPVRLSLSNKKSFSAILHETANSRAEAERYQFSIDDIYQSALTDHARLALRTTAPFDVLLKFNKNALRLNLKNISASHPHQIDLGYIDTSLFQLTLNQLDDGSCEGFLNYNTDLFDEETIDRLLGHWQKILSTAAYHPECDVDTIPLPLKMEQQLIDEFNQNDAPEFSEHMTPDAFTVIASRIPNQTALAFHSLDGEITRLTFQELDAYTNQIANFLLTRCNLKKGDHISFSITRSINLVALTLGALKAGLVIAPLETTSSKLLEYKLKHANPAFIVTDQHTNPIFQHRNNPNLDLSNTFVLNIDNPFIARRIRQANTTFGSPELSADTPAYIMFSSGTSTGVPKASLLTHGGLANLFNALRHQNYPAGLNVLCTALPTFDAFLFDFLVAWSNGGTAHLTSDEERYSPEAVERVIRQENINFAVFLPDLMSLLPADLPLDYTISMGAAPHESTFEQWLAARPARKIINGLGHTETGICLSLQEYKPGADPDLVGTPIHNMKMFVLNPQHFTQCPIGVPGEIFVAGPGLAAEYIGNLELTHSKFLTMRLERENNKFTPCDAHNPDAVRLYASGDFGCYQITNKGTLSIKSIGRTDRIIKLFGVSIDLDGVETLINANPQVQTVAIIPNPDMSGLLAYVVRSSEFRRLSSDKARNILRQYLRNTLLHPVAYPKRMIFMTELPKTANGKIDLKKLPLPPARELAKPRSNQDITLALTSMWREVLGSDDADKIDPDTTFEELGGHSIALAILEGRINRELALSKHIGFGGNFLSPKMNLRSLSTAIKPLLANTASTTNHSTNRFEVSQSHHHTGQSLFHKVSESRNMGTIESQNIGALSATSSRTRK